MSKATTYIFASNPRVEEKRLAILNNAYNANTLEILLDKIKDGMEVLEVGCGYGEMSRALFEHRPNIKYWGIDKDTNAIKKAEKEKSNPDAKYFELGIDQLSTTEGQEIASKKYDVIFFRWVLAYTDKEKFIENLKRLYGMVKKGGYLICEECDVYAVKCITKEEGADIEKEAMRKWLDLTKKVDEKFSANFALGANLKRLVETSLDIHPETHSTYHPSLTDKAQKKILTHGIKSGANAIIDAGLATNEELCELITKLRDQIIYDEEVDVKYVESTTIVLSKSTDTVPSL